MLDGHVSQEAWEAVVSEDVRRTAIDRVDLSLDVCREPERSRARRFSGYRTSARVSSEVNTVLIHLCLLTQYDTVSTKGEQRTTRYSPFPENASRPVR